MNYDRRHSLEHSDRPRLTEQTLPRRGNLHGLRAEGAREDFSRRGETALVGRSRNSELLPTSAERAKPTPENKRPPLQPSKGLTQIVDGDTNKVQVSNHALAASTKGPKKGAAPQAAAPAPSGNTKRRDHRSALSSIDNMLLSTPLPQPQYVKGRRVRAEDLTL